MASVKLKKPNLTEGPIFSRIITVALPLMATNLLQTFYNAADMIIVGLSPVKDAVGAIGISTTLINLLLNLFIGLSVGTNIVVAKHIGEGDDKKTSAAVHTSVIMSLIFGTAIGAIGFFITKPILFLMGAEGSFLELANIYAQIFFSGSPFLALTNYLSSIYRAKGDTKTPLVVLSASGALNVLLNVFFVLGLGLSVEGVALATVISNVASAAVLLLLLRKENGPCKFSFRRLAIDKKEFIDIIYLGIPVGIQSTLFSLSNTIIQSSILEVNGILCPPGSEYQAVVRGNSAATSISNFVFAAANAIPQSIVSFVGQNVGAKRYDRVKKISACGFIIAAMTSILFTLTVYLLRNPLLSLYGVVPSKDILGSIAYNAASTRFKYHLLPFILYSFMDTASSIAKAMKRALTSTIIALIGTCLLRIVWLTTIFRYFLNLESIYISYPISWLLTGIVQLALAIFCIKTDEKKHLAEVSTELSE